jgi:hypothetical protein
MADIFQKGNGNVDIKQPITADKCTITIDGSVIADAIQFQCNYQQQVTRRRSIGNQSAILYSSMPQGSITVSRLLTEDAKAILNSKVFSCEGGEIAFEGAGCKGGGSLHYTARGVMISGYSLTASADDLTVMDNLSFEFIELSAE